ncbi:site-specific integrase [Oricola sp.]|uniref:site-specific integrase n=1 Tax=Oricola sp. TaxID=1979950 RepID=UPI0025E354B5|nr:site-specific integrase [Oricola sp.]MCI5076395.1 site-specific integrase [Oricola sp.]
MTKLFYPHAERLRSLGFHAAAEVPVLFDASGRYCREHNRYLRERALGKAGIGDRVPWEADRIPLPKTLENAARYLGVFIDWCGFTKSDWRTLCYKVGVLAFQNDMALGRWSLSGRKNDPRTANQRADEAAAFLAWAADRGLREPFNIERRLLVRRTRSASSSRKGMRTDRSRLGRLPESRSKDVEKVGFLPRPQQVRDWLHAVRDQKGYAKYLASRFVLEAGTRLFETVAINEDQIPSREKLVELSSAGQLVAPVTLLVTKGGRPRTIFLAIPFLLEIRQWIEGKRLRLRYLWHKRKKAPPSPRLFLSDARGHEGTPISKARLYDCFREVNPRPTGWHTHAGRHTYACFFVLYALEDEAASAGRALSSMGADWIVARGTWYLKTLQKQLGHLSEETTELYLRWLVTASGLSSAATGWHSFLSDGSGEEFAT